MESKLGEILGGQTADEKEMEDRLKEARLERLSAIKEIQASLLAGGEGTGNRLHDELVLMYGTMLLDGESIIARYEKVNESLKGKNKQPVIVIKRWLEDMEHAGIPGSDWSPRRGIQKSVTIGIINANEIVFDRESKLALLPTSQYVKVSDRYWRQAPEIKEGNLAVDTQKATFLQDEHLLGYFLDKKMDFRGERLEMPLNSGEDIYMEIFAGHNEIQGWLNQDTLFTRAGYSREISKGYQLLNIRPAEQQEEEREKMLLRRIV